MKFPVITGGWFRNVFTVLNYCTLLVLAAINQGHACPVNNNHIEMTINGHILTAEVAGDLESHMCGLAFRDDLPADHGMLFAYAEDQIIGFWMKDTFIALSIAFLDAGGKIVEIHDMKPKNTTLRYISRVPVRYALEMKQGWFNENGIVIGDRVEFDLHTHPDVFRYQRVSE